ncbi:uncharacterized protein NPIL_651291 [Nephila pilipes]|uniref:Uncharacterized protein n=1 Tax=Nephila pilipes TaxID=299642 RepID=A0A8X6TUG1_NEPPI|nr:uncharacterized protein NPIL_651291 [Nephila pilipes]
MTNNITLSLAQTCRDSRVQKTRSVPYSPRLIVFAAICSRKLYSPLFFVDRSVKRHTFLDMLQIWLMKQLQDSQDLIFQQYGVPFCFSNDVRGYLKEHLPQYWIRYNDRDDEVLLRWPLMCLQTTTCHFILWDFIEDRAFVSPLPQHLIKQ